MKKSHLLTLFLLLCTIYTQAQNKKPKHIILIGVDGLGAYSIPGSKLRAINKQLSSDTSTNFVDEKYHTKAKVPTLEKLMKDGAYSLTTRSVLPSSSAVNWASMTMGAGPEIHGYTEWGSKKPELPSRTLDRYGMFPSIFSLLKDQKPDAEIGVVYEWDGIGYLFPKKAVSLDANCEGDSATALTASNYIINKKPNLLFIHLHDVDHIGHSIGHGTPEYYKSVSQTDAYIGQIVQAVQKAGIADETLIIVSADHGGINKGHGGKTMQEMNIPWIAYGKSIKKKGEITESMMTYDTAATIAWLLNLKTPQAWIGRPVKQIFE